MRWTVTLALAAILSACGGPKGPSAAQLEAARAKVHGFQPWDQAETALRSTLGDPTTQDDDGMTWVAHDGGKCHTLRVTKMAKTVGTVSLGETPCP
jgi:uncharacterized membrane protein